MNLCQGAAQSGILAPAPAPAPALALASALALEPDKCRIWGPMERRSFKATALSTMELNAILIGAAGQAK